jgi:hypothetical protein
MVDQYALHIANLLATQSITVTWKPSGNSGRAWRKRKHVAIPAIKTAISYALALHEIGHILGKNPSTRLGREAAAWQWALDNAILWTPVMEAKMQRCLASYDRWAKRRKGAALSEAFDNLRERA